MELTGSTIIAQPKEKVWAALNDEAILQQCITGCEAMQRVDAHSMSARLGIKLGPVRAKFNGQVSMSNIRPLEGYTLTFEGSGGAAGFAKGSSNVALITVETGTQVSYTVNASVGGKLGQIGGRMIDAAAKGMADDFFSAFGKALETNNDAPTISKTLAPATADTHPTTTRAAPQAQPHAPVTTASTASIASTGTSDSRLFWFCAGIACGTILLLIGKHFL
jgi:uncharacterized protein